MWIAAVFEKHVRVEAVSYKEHGFPHTSRTTLGGKVKETSNRETAVGTACVFVECSDTPDSEWTVVQTVHVQKETKENTKALALYKGDEVPDTKSVVFVRY